MRNRTGQEPPTHSEEWQAEVLLREYDNLAHDNRTLVTGQYTLGMIAVALVLGVVGAAFEVGRGEIVLALPASLLLVISGIGLQFGMMHHIAKHLSAVEKRVNGLCSADQSLLLTWYSRYNFPNLGHDPRNPMARLLRAMHLLVVGAFLGVLAAGGKIQAACSAIARLAFTLRMYSLSTASFLPAHPGFSSFLL